MSLRHAFRSDNTHRGMGRTQRRLRAAAVAGVVVAVPVVGVAAASSASAADASVWDKVAQCESSGNWSTNTGNGFYGGLQFTQSTWNAYGGSGSAQNASKAEQIAVAQRVLAGQGPGAWPVCSVKAGLTSGNGGSASAASSSAKSTTTTSTSTTKSTKSYTSTPKQTAPVAPKTAPKVTVSAPVKSAPKTAPKAAPTTTTVSSAKGGYTVKAGDTLSSIASSHGVNGGWHSLYSKNASVLGGNPNLIFPGQVISLG